MKFDFEYYDKNYDRNGVAMHCPTKKAAVTFLNHLDSIGKHWSSGDSYLKETNWCEYQENTVYFFLDGTYCHVGYGGTLELEFEDFDWGDDQEVDDMEFCSDEEFEMLMLA